MGQSRVGQAPRSPCPLRPLCARAALPVRLQTRSRFKPFDGKRRPQTKTDLNRAPLSQAHQATECPLRRQEHAAIPAGRLLKAQGCSCRRAPRLFRIGWLQYGLFRRIL